MALALINLLGGSDVVSIGWFLDIGPVWYWFPTVVVSSRVAFGAGFVGYGLR